MNERQTIQDLTDLLAAKHGMAKKDAEAFVKEFFLLIEEALENETYVKIKGLGTFKLIEVDSRESVSVSTGERFQIKGHTKISFTPDTNLKDTINKPFAHFETVVLNESTVLDDTSIEEEEEEVIFEIPAMKESIIEETTEQSDVPVTEWQPEVTDEKAEYSAEQIIAHELQKANLKPEMPKVQPEILKPENDTTVIPKKEKSPVPYLITIIVIVLLLCGSAILFIYYPDLFSSASDKDTLEMPVATQPTSVQPEALITDSIERKDTVKEANPKVLIEPVKAQAIVTKETKSPSAYLDSATYTISGTKATHTIKEGETLTKVALHYYGTKAMWPYIVKHNPTVIKNPDNVPYGTTIKIPELTKK